jgi:hypothetical protein
LFGLRQIVIGTGGRDYRKFGLSMPGSEVRIPETFGVLKLTLRADSYDWEFIPEAGKTLTDQGTTACHGVPPASEPAPVTPATEPRSRRSPGERRTDRRHQVRRDEGLRHY